MEQLDIIRDAYHRRGTLHHACLIEGDVEAVIPLLRGFFEKEFKIKTRGNPDFHVYEYDSLGIEDGRQLQSFAVQKAYGPFKVFITGFNMMTFEAQNALLKLFEEPVKNTHFFLITKNSDKLLGTLRSRLFILPRLTDALPPSSQERIDSFLSGTRKERLAFVKKMIEDKDRAKIAQFLDALEYTLYETWKQKRDDAHVTEALEELSRVRQYALDRSGSPKLILEHIALSIPDMDASVVE